MKKNPAAVALGLLAAGKPKKFTKAERARRAARMRELNKARRENAKTKVRNSIAGYQKRQDAITDAIAKAGGELHQDAFDAAFKRRGFLSEGVQGSDLVLGNISQGYHGEMLHLAQLMVASGILETRGTPPNLRYALSPHDKP